MQPLVPMSDNNKVASAATIVNYFGIVKNLLNYFGIVKNLLRNKFPNHPEWPQSPSDNPIWYKESVANFNNPIWYKESVANFKKEYERNARTWSEEDYQRGSNKIRALYRYDHQPDLEPEDLGSMAFWYDSDLVGAGPTPPVKWVGTSTPFASISFSPPPH